MRDDDNGGLMLYKSKLRARDGKIASSPNAFARTTGDGPPDIGANLRRLRHQQGLSLETLAKNSGVSRAMLGQIETGKSVPTITLVWKVAKALGIPATTLIVDPETVAFSLVRKSENRLLMSSDGRFVLRPISASSYRQPFEFYELRIAAGHLEHLEARPSGSHATLVLTSGAIIVSIGDETAAELEAGDAILFQPDTSHSFFNSSQEDASGYLVVTPHRNGAT